MGTTTVHFDEDDEEILDRLAPDFGGRSRTLREGLRLLATEVDRRTAWSKFVDDWIAETGPVDDLGHLSRSIGERGPEINTWP